MRARNNATPTGDPLTRWIELGSPVEKMLEMNEPLSEERNCIVRRRIMGRRRKPTGVRRSEMKSVMASPFSPSSVGTNMTATTTTAKRTPCGGPRRCCSSIIVLLNERKERSKE